jgi:hypothetical protein
MALRGPLTGPDSAVSHESVDVVRLLVHRLPNALRHNLPFDFHLSYDTLQTIPFPRHRFFIAKLQLASAITSPTASCLRATQAHASSAYFHHIATRHVLDASTLAALNFPFQAVAGHANTSPSQKHIGHESACWFWSLGPFSVGVGV